MFDYIQLQVGTEDLLSQPLSLEMFIPLLTKWEGRKGEGLKAPFLISQLHVISSSVEYRVGTLELCGISEILPGSMGGIFPKYWKRVVGHSVLQGPQASRAAIDISLTLKLSSLLSTKNKQQNLRYPQTYPIVTCPVHGLC